MKLLSVFDYTFTSIQIPTYTQTHTQLTYCCLLCFSINIIVLVLRKKIKIRKYFFILFNVPYFYISTIEEISDVIIVVVDACLFNTTTTFKKKQIVRLEIFAQWEAESRVCVLVHTNKWQTRRYQETTHNKKNKCLWIGKKLWRQTMHVPDSQISFLRSASFYLIAQQLTGKQAVLCYHTLYQTSEYYMKTYITDF